MDDYEIAWMIKKVPNDQVGMTSNYNHIAWYSQEGTYLVSWTLVITILIATTIGIALRSWGEH